MALPWPMTGAAGAVCGGVGDGLRGCCWHATGVSIALNEAYTTPIHSRIGGEGEARVVMCARIFVRGDASQRVEGGVRGGASASCLGEVWEW